MTTAVDSVTIKLIWFRMHDEQLNEYNLLKSKTVPSIEWNVNKKHHFANDHFHKQWNINNHFLS